MFGPREGVRQRKLEAAGRGNLPLECCLAKTRRLSNGSADGHVVEGRTVIDHSRLAGAVADELLDRLPDMVRSLFPANASVAPLLHDVGKVCPTFQKKLYRALGKLSPRLELDEIDPDIEKDWGGHAAVSYAVLKTLCSDPYLAEVVGLHHGRAINHHSAACGLFGGERWETAREELVSRLMEGRPWPVITGAGQALALAGLTVTADWIASGNVFDDPEVDWRPLVEQAVDAAGFRRPRVREGLRFNEIFPFDPNPVQQAFLDQVSGPGEYILEAPMGLGKTEAALYAAYRLLEKGQASGLYFALPTQLTSNKIHDRVNAFLKQILENSAEPRGAVLTHGNAWLKRFLKQDMGMDASPGGAWFESGRRGILAPFAVGTIDQALMAVIHVRHAAVRAFGLAGKVVILDEVHSYDAYTGVFLRELVRLLHALKCTTIILSATLTGEWRAELAGVACKHNLSHEEYPLITSIPAEQEATEIPCRLPVRHEVSIQMCRNDEDALEEALLRVEQGQQVLWIENTVAEAQELYRRCAAMASALHLETGLLHSRFTPADRERNESLWTSLYGAKTESRGKTGRLLIGTQVLEQSLDIDADFLVSRICPTDMLFQRLGRLWRHSRSDRAPSARREAWVLAPDMETALHSPETTFGKTGHVYSPYVLCRTLEVWATRDRVTLPDDIRPLLEATYCSRAVEPTPAMSEAWNQLQIKKRQMCGQALQGLVDLGAPQPEEWVTTRLMQGPEEVKVLLLQSWDAARKYCRLADGTECVFASGQSKAERTRIAVNLALHTLRVPETSAPQPLTPNFSRVFAPYVYEAGDYQNRLRVILVRADGSCADVYGNALPGLSYTSELGYMKQA